MGTEHICHGTSGAEQRTGLALSIAVDSVAHYWHLHYNCEPSLVLDGPGSGASLGKLSGENPRGRMADLQPAHFPVHSRLAVADSAGSEVRQLLSLIGARLSLQFARSTVPGYILACCDSWKFLSLFRPPTHCCRHITWRTRVIACEPAADVHLRG